MQHWITDGTFKPGEKINDFDLANALGISRTPIREALQILEMQGFIEMSPGKETKVTVIKEQDVIDIYPPLATLMPLLQN